MVQRLKTPDPSANLDPPFSLNPSTRHFYLTKQYAKLLQNAIDLVLKSEGLGIVAGEVGTGKSTLIRYLIDWFAENMPVGLNQALIYNPTYTSDFQLLKAICAEFGVPPRPQKTQQLDDLRDFLVNAHAKGQVSVVIIDEAHKLNAAQLELVREFFNFSRNDGFYIQVLLAGEAKPLAAKLKQKKAIKSRAAFYGTIRPLSLPDTIALVQYRLRTSGTSVDVFDDDALEAMHRLSGGVPRRLVKLGRLLFEEDESPERITVADVLRIHAEHSEVLDV